MLGQGLCLAVRTVHTDSLRWSRIGACDWPMSTDVMFCMPVWQCGTCHCVALHAPQTQRALTTGSPCSTLSCHRSASDGLIIIFAVWVGSCPASMKHLAVPGFARCRGWSSAQARPCTCAVAIYRRLHRSRAAP